MADKAYSSAGNRAWLRQHHIQAVIPVKDDQKKHRRNRGRAGGRPPAFDAGWYKKRNTVERCFSKLKQFRWRSGLARQARSSRVYPAVAVSRYRESGRPMVCAALDPLLRRMWAAGPGCSCAGTV
jgi:transposase